MNQAQITQLIKLFTAEKESLESKGLSYKQVFGVLYNKEYVTKSGIIFTLKSTGLVNQVFIDSPEQTEIDFNI